MRVCLGILIIPLGKHISLGFNWFYVTSVHIYISTTKIKDCFLKSSFVERDFRQANLDPLNLVNDPFKSILLDTYFK